MGQFSKVLLAIDNVYTVSPRALDCGPGLAELRQVDGPNCSTPSGLLYQPVKSPTFGETLTYTFSHSSS